ncbi:MAG: aspartyl protease family protein [Verrucomicrobia bacterium]|nr:aspartyl protease family protein [Verrucomicrobiota bacterium]MBU4246764.1 aspartyl protease family protein [Verrucomicrobiota bacterium]MBU4291185.1 aspartyl protease family protein [Verrucomicrobiota bacterium]MBU4496943.1 aspartyl protease family protein [Verrucomicrobiota bacterium]MCG2681924.1 aspartyl protease family protein [Kiritimatiellia bacterium]
MKRALIAVVLISLLSIGLLADETIFLRSNLNWYFGPYKLKQAQAILGRDKHLTTIVQKQNSPLEALLTQSGYKKTRLCLTGSGLYEMPVRCGDRDAYFLVDSGAGNYLIFQSLIDSWNLATTKTSTSIGEMTLVSLHNFGFGVDPTERALVIPNKHTKFRPNDPDLLPDRWEAFGIIGSPFIKTTKAIMDCSSGSLFLHDPDKSLADRIGLDSLMKTNGYQSIEMRWNDERKKWFLPISMDGNKWDGCVDTGSSVTCIDAALAGKLGTEIPGTSSPLRGATHDDAKDRTWRVSIREFKLGAFTTCFPYINVISSPGGHNKPGVELGNDILLTHCAVIDFGRNKLYLKHPDKGHAEQRPERDK